MKKSLDAILALDGAMCAAVVDSGSGMILGQAGSGMDMEVAAAGNTEVMKAMVKTMASLGINDHIEDILITLNKHYHIICPMPSMRDELFVYVVLDKAKSNLALARRKVHDVEHDLNV